MVGPVANGYRPRTFSSSPGAYGTLFVVEYHNTVTEGDGVFIIQKLGLGDVAPVKFGTVGGIEVREGPTTGGVVDVGVVGRDVVG